MFLAAGLIPLAVSGILGHWTANVSLKELAFNQLVSVRETKKEQIEEYFSNIEKQIRTYSKERMIINAMEEFELAFKRFRKENEINDAQLSLMMIPFYYNPNPIRNWKLIQQRLF